MDASDPNEESSPMTAFDSVQRNYNNITASDQAYSEVSFLSYDPTLFDGVPDWSIEDFWSQPFALDTSFNNNLPQQFPPLMEDEIMCPFSHYIDETDQIDWLHDMLQ